MAATNRASIAWVIAEVTIALLPHRPDRPDDRHLRLALRKWALVPGRLDRDTTCPPDIREAVKWIDEVIDPRVVGNTAQVEAMLTAVSYIGTGRGPHLVALYGCMYYAMMRPSEVIKLQRSQCELPDDGGWGRLILEGAAPQVESEYSDDGTSHDERGLKGRSARSTRPVPIPPRLVELLRAHIDRYGMTADGRLFRTRTGNFIGGDAYRGVWRSARDYGIAWADKDGPRLKHPYDLRHSGVSLRRTAGVPSKQVAEWAGRSVEVLERIYSKVLEGYDHRWQQQMGDFF